MRERGRERVRGVRGGRRARASETTLSWEWVGSGRRGQQQRSEVERRGQWQPERKQGRGNQKERSYDEGLYNQTTPYFFTNFPEHWSYADMWRTFLHYGRVFDIYCPNRRSRNGTRFGFVRFLEVKDRKELERKLDQIWVNDMKLWVNSPRYDVEKIRSKQRRISGEGTSQLQAHNYVEAREEKISGERMPQKQKRSYAEVVKDNQRKRFCEEDNTQNQSIQERSNSRIRFGPHNREPRKRWQEKGRREDWVGMEYNINPEEYSWLKGCYVGTVYSIDMVRNLQEKFYMEGYFSCKIVAMGGRLVLLDCEDKEELKDLVEMAAEWLGQWFEKVCPWTPETVANERFVWMRCQWAPLNVWGADFFQKMGSSWGKFICLDDSTSKKKRFDIARFLISTPISNSISVLRRIKINGIIYNIKFTEEEFTNSFFSLKQDFMPSFQSDSEEQEMWSTESEMEEQNPENAGDEMQEEVEGYQEEDDDVVRSCGKKVRTAQSQKKTAMSEISRIGGRQLATNSKFENSGKKRRGRDGEQISREAVISNEPERGEWGGSSLGVIESKAKGIMDFSRVEDSAEDNTEEDADLVWKGYVSESGSMQRGKSKLSEGITKRKGQRVRNCSSVYLNTHEMDRVRGRSRGRGRGKQIGLSRVRSSMPDFEPNPNGKVAGDSVGDSEIHQRNKALKKKLQIGFAKEIWELAKQLGATTEDEEEIIRRIEEMENRDRQGKVTEGNQKEIGSKKEETPVCILNIYSPCHLTGKRELWEELYNLIISKKGCWCLSGDYNSVRRVEERAGCHGVSREMKEFDEFILRSELIDLPLVGRKFTWYNSNGKQMSRIDRFLVSEDWIAKWSDIKQWGLRRTVSDHCPILLKNEKVDWGPKPFKFFDSWLEQPGCKELVTNSWKSTEVKGWRGFILKEKLQRTKKVLKEWSAKSVTEMDKRIKDAENMIAEIDEKGEINQLATDEIELRRNSFLELWKNLRIKERMSQQKSRKMWLKEGDANTRFFHSCIQGRRRRSEINSIQIDGEQFTGVTKIKEEVARYFQSLFSEEGWKRPKLDGVSFKQISQEDNELLTKGFSEEEVKEAIWDCDSAKSPGPDGFNFRFIKEMWEVIKPEVVAFIQEFHKHGRIVRGANASFVVLIPKTENPQRIEEYRPISLIGVMYKIIAKLLANRLRKVLTKVIGEQQMAFIGGRQLVDGVIIANEVIDEVKRKKKSCFIFKVDFEKAYDKVCWEFLDYMMMRLGFNETWRRWISECLKSSSVSVLINGSPTSQFSVSKGIRQGDPLSPFLFLIVAEGLNGLMTSAVEKEIYKGVRVGNEGVMVSHLQFADDTVFFGEASEDNIRVVKTVLRIFELASGLKINFRKSHVMGVGVAESWQTEMAYRLHCKEGELPFKYLGIPIGGNNRRKAMWQPMIQAVERKLASWKGRYLSMGGRITLINSVLSSLPVFLMSAYVIPKGTLLSIDKIRRRFLWGGGAEERKINWVSWRDVCKSKDEGGLGVRVLRKFNLALMGNWWGRLAKMEEGLWMKIISAKYGMGGKHWMDWIKDNNGRGSLWWRDVCCLDRVNEESVGWLSEGFRMKIGDGNSASFWWDDWGGEGCLANKFPRLYILSTGKEKTCNQMGNLRSGSWKWKLSWRRNLFEWEDEEVVDLERMIEGTKITQGRPDKWEWIHDKERQYSSKSAYHILATDQSGPNGSTIFKRTWNTTLPTKVSAFNWQLMLDRIPTKVNLLKRGIIKDMEESKCVVCEEQEEDSAHLFLRCKLTRWLWEACAQWWGAEAKLDIDCLKTFEKFGDWSKEARTRQGWDCLWSTVVWTVWLARNQKIFQHKEISARKLFELIQLRSFIWIKAKNDRYAFTLSDWLLNPVDCIKVSCRRRKAIKGKAGCNVMAS
ncbi:hypothetical protein SLEP1_g3583 [Rubroshorea leprosula]|uniref:Reverse transcriptase domain-containing protein n=1 Tax=Rubroshorea leprosula TaxID=152421 RepID=A0AAV5HLE6_9ROSI|nr:hypothetical protein SLEP1_g3583 [Rubroshorea leprosula]